MNEKHDYLLIPPPSARLKTWRLSQGLTQRQVASLLGVPTNTVSRWEQEARRLRGLYRRAVEALMAGETEKPKSEAEKVNDFIEEFTGERPTTKGTK